MTNNFFPEPVEALDARFKEWAQTSKKAPSEFAEAELRRIANMWLIRGFTKAYGKDEHCESFTDHWCSDFLENIETEFRCYFEQEEAKKVNTNLRLMWKRVYGGSDGSTEGYIHDHGFVDALTTLGWDPWNPVDSVKKDELDPLLYRYLIGIGYLFPEGDELIVHPNHLRAQERGIFTADGVPFLPYLTHRLPMYAARSYEKRLTDEEMWRFFGELTGMSMAGFPSRGPYGARDFHNEPIPYVKWHQEVGAHLIPQRYISIKPRIGKYEWLIPEVKPDNPCWR